MNMYHGIIIDQSFKDLKYPKNFKVFAKKRDGNWGIYGIEIKENHINETVSMVQKAMKVGTWYAHFYNDTDLVVVFRNRVFRIGTNISTWSKVFEYGKRIGIKVEQLDFWPNRFQDEIHYFSSEDFVK